MPARQAVSAKSKRTFINNNSMSGFTIIEVVLVLAIAGLIFMMVFIALPQLQRAQRDTQRRNDFSRLQAAIGSFQNNNNGRLPSGTCNVVAADANNPLISEIPNDVSGASACRLIKEYLHGVNDTLNTFADPSGKPYSVEFEVCAGTVAGVDCSRTVNTTDFENRKIYVETGATCNGEKAVHSNNARDFAILYRLEGNGSYCHNN